MIFSICYFSLQELIAAENVLLAQDCFAPHFSDSLMLVTFGAQNYSKAAIYFYAALSERSLVFAMFFSFFTVYSPATQVSMYSLT